MASSENISKYNLEAAIKKFTDEMFLPGDIFMEMLESSIDPTRQDLAVLQSAILDQNWESIQTVSHRLKGVFGNLRLDDLGGAAGRMNHLAKNKEGHEEIKKIFADFQKQFSLLCAALAR
jgi:HPt (histidine-containing phosphotransfer) domain-containing protein